LKDEEGKVRMNDDSGFNRMPQKVRIESRRSSLNMGVPPSVFDKAQSIRLVRNDLPADRTKKESW
jgi:hypothetical protein